PMLPMADLVEALPVGLVINDLDGRFVFANEAAADLLGVTRDRLIGYVLRDGGFDIVDESGDPYKLDDVPARRVILSGEPVRKAVLGSMDRSTQRRRWLLVHANPLRDAAGTMIGVVSAFSDFTARHQADAEAQRQRRELDALN